MLRPRTAAKLSLRLPPTLDAEAAGTLLKTLLEADPPYGAQGDLRRSSRPASGWNAPALAPWLRASIDRASQAAFGRPAAMMGEGGTIPFMGMLGEKFPAAQFLITGVLGPHSNAHGPNEFLHIATGKGVTPGGGPGAGGPRGGRLTLRGSVFPQRTYGKWGMPNGREGMDGRDGDEPCPLASAFLPAASWQSLVSAGSL